MKKYYPFLLLLLATLLACNSDPSDSGGTEPVAAGPDSSEMVVAPSASQPDLEVVAPSAEKAEIVAQQKVNSQFARLGCCAEEAQRTQECCCGAVIEEYRKMFTAEAVDQLAQLNEDVIFNDCKKIKRWRAAIEEIEAPAEEEEPLF
ncbi:MAG: hypothetical protein AAFW73_21570 [Bacteroidota bacterium]